MLRQERRIVRPANPEQWPRVTQIKAKRFPPRCCHHHHVLRVDAIFCPPGSVTVSPENWFFVAHVVVPQISRVDISTQPALPRKIILFAQFLKSSPRPDVPGLFYAPRCTRSKKKTQPDIILCVQGCQGESRDNCLSQPEETVSIWPPGQPIGGLRSSTMPAKYSRVL